MADGGRWVVVMMYLHASILVQWARTNRHECEKVEFCTSSASSMSNGNLGELASRSPTTMSWRPTPLPTRSPRGRMMADGRPLLFCLAALHGVQDGAAVVMFDHDPWYAWGDHFLSSCLLMILYLYCRRRRRRLSAESARASSNFSGTLIMYPWCLTKNPLRHIHSNSTRTAN